MVRIVPRGYNIHLLTFGAIDTLSSTSSHPSDEWMALISGLDIGAPSPYDAQIQMLVEYLAGEQGGTEDQVAASQISRLIIAGDSLSPVLISESTINSDEKKSVSANSHLQSLTCSTIIPSAPVWLRLCDFLPTSDRQPLSTSAGSLPCITRPHLARSQRPLWCHPPTAALPSRHVRSCIILPFLHMRDQPHLHAYRPVRL